MFEFVFRQVAHAVPRDGAGAGAGAGSRSRPDPHVSRNDENARGGNASAGAGVGAQPPPPPPPKQAWQDDERKGAVPRGWDYVKKNVAGVFGGGGAAEKKRRELIRDENHWRSPDPWVRLQLPKVRLRKGLGVRGEYTCGLASHPRRLRIYV